MLTGQNDPAGVGAIKRISMVLSLIHIYIRYVVLDEADEMLDMGFREDIEAILACLPQQRQTLMFSATLPQEILSLAYRYMRDPEQVKIANTEENLPDIEQRYMVVPPASRSDIVRCV